MPLIIAQPSEVSVAAGASARLTVAAAGASLSYQWYQGPLLDFTKPVEGHNIAELSLEPRAGGTEVIWSMRGPSPYLMKLMGVFVNLDRMIGGEFETGLSNLKAVAER